MKKPEGRFHPQKHWWDLQPIPCPRNGPTNHCSASSLGFTVPIN